MKKAGIVIVVLILVTAMALGAWRWYEWRRERTSEAPDPLAAFQIWSDQPMQTLKRGERGEFLVHLKNNTGKPYSYQGSYYSFRPTARLISADGSFEILFDELPMTMEFAHYTIEVDEVRDTVFSFRVPEDAPTGRYDLVLSFESPDLYTIREIDVLRVTE